MEMTLDTSSHAQRKRLLEHMHQHGFITTISARSDLDVTQRAKLRVIEAHEAESPGAAFLDGIGFWPFDSKPKQE